MDQLDHKEVFNNMSRYLNELFEQAEDQVVEAFCRIVGSSDPTDWEKEGYKLITIVRKADLMKKSLILLRGGDRVITAVNVELKLDQHKMWTVTEPLSEEKVKTLLGGNK